MDNKDEQVDIKVENHPNTKIEVYQIKYKTIFGNVLNLIKNEKSPTETVKHEIENDTTKKKENYRISICQDGKFAATFDTANLRVKILENPDYHQFGSSDQNVYNDKKVSDEPDEIDKTVAHFQIKDDFTIDKFYNTNCRLSPFQDDLCISDSNIYSSDSIEKKEDEKNGTSKWSFDVSNMHKMHGKNDNEYFILVAVSCINVDEDMRATEKENKNNNKRKLSDNNHSPDNTSEQNDKTGFAIYRLELIKKNESYTIVTITRYYCNEISGICRFVISEKDGPELLDDAKQKRLVVLNFHGIHSIEFNDNRDSFHLSEKFQYPISIRRELDDWYITKDDGNDCIKRLRSCIYDKYFLVTQYKDDVQSLEVYNLATMELETTAKKDDQKDVFVNEFYSDNFSVNNLQFCFTQGNNTIRENGLQITSKEFEKLKKIFLLEFFDNDEKLLIIGKDPEGKTISIIWDLYNTGKYTKPVELDNFPGNSIKEYIRTRVARTSGNILQVNDYGTVSSVIKEVKKKLNQKNDNKEEEKIRETCKKCAKFRKIVDDTEPWVLGRYDSRSYCLYHDETETLQLIVGRSTVQIWHQINTKQNEQLPNKGKPFLEYIWTNRIPINQEINETRLQVEKFEYGANDELHEKLSDFRLKVYWYEIEDNKENIKKEEHAEKGDEITKMNEVDKEIHEIERKLKEINENNELDKEEKSVKVKRCEEIIERKDIIEKFHAVIHACKALEHLNRRYKNKRLANNYIRVHRYEEMISYISHIVWRFAKNEPEKFKLLDVRHNIMKNLILGDCDHLIKFILFGSEDETIENNNYYYKEKEIQRREKERKKKFEIRHIPRNVLWPGETFIKNGDLCFDERMDRLKDNEDIMPENNMELAIYHCKGRELKDTIIIAYLLEYYSSHATDCAGWMCTVSKAIPLLFKYNYDDYARKLFFKECFADQDHFSAQDPNEIIPTEYQERRNHNIKFRAFRPIDKLKSDKDEWYDHWVQNPFNSLRNNIIKKYENFDNDLGRSPIALRVVPLPGFTKNRVKKKKVEYNFFKIISNLFLFIFIPRLYKISRNERKKLSPFSRMILYENNDDIYDNPATEAVINFRWQKARNFFFLLFFRFIIFAVCFGIVSWSYLNRSNVVNGNFLFSLIIIFYYLALFLLVTELLQLHHRGPKKYFDAFNVFDIISIVCSVTIMTIIHNRFQFSDGFESVKEIDTRLIVGISFSIFLLWIELIFYLRLVPNIGIYIYYSIIIFKTVYPFFLFMLVVILAFAHTMFVLLRDPTNIQAKTSTYSGNATSVLTNETLKIELKSDFDPASSDNPYTSFSQAIIATYFWISGIWVQRDEFDYWVADVYTLIGSVVIVIVLLNMLIAFMGGVYENAETKGRQTLLRHKANHIADYEALYHTHFRDPDPEPIHIYYFGQSKTFEEWYTLRKNDQGAIFKGFEEKTTFTKRIFKERNFDRSSIWKFDVKVDMELKKIKKMKNDLNFSIEHLSRILNQKEKDDEIKEKIQKIENIEIKKLLKIK
ncbi:hypothetical protein RclHR1_17170001 [Rhizophagus clarus]|uniref:Ion transport domain-containing protein n=1 Tax=Rhizophagus clarus TaxID=94130 RepID=A0A2Z6QJJ6_9GLOM|nr:hypothetical protein RclHR1_17170001 [Rhizophagus clarus]